MGETVELATPSGRITADVVGVTEFGRSPSVDGGGTVFFAPDSALDVLGVGSQQYGRILLRTDGSTEDLIEAVQPLVPSNDAVLSGEAFMEHATADTQAFVDFLRPVLLGFAFLALFVAGFVIYNTFTVVVTQRSRELALVRSIGGTPAQVRRSLLGEGFLLGLGASVLGLGVGVALSWGLQWILEQLDVGLPGAGFALSPWTVVITVVAGTFVTVLSVMVPAFRAGRTRPVEAMRESAVDHSGTSAFRLYLGGGLLAVGVVALLLNRFAWSHPLLFGFGAFVLFWGW
ncbi:MAG: FtsX-like permease family protein [Microthrixaceae bacterium]|nr:FtsX-like permease family protein [Microthrixaceae bacterium]